MKRSPILKSKISNLDSSRHAFTLVELLVSVGIFTMMTALVVVKYGNFNQSVLLTNLAYDIALTIRTAQTYGLSVKNSDLSGGGSDFQSGYGVHFDTRSGVADVDPELKVKNNQAIILFADISPPGGDGVYTEGSDRSITRYAIKRGAVVYGVCFTADCTPPSPLNKPDFVDITFKRPEPNAKICFDQSANNCNTPNKYIEISVKGTDGSFRTISVSENGQISVKN